MLCKISFMQTQKNEGEGERKKPVPVVRLQPEEVFQVSEERVHVVLRVEYDIVRRQRGQNLVVAVLKIPVLSFPDGIAQLVLVKVHHLPWYGGQVGSGGNHEMSISLSIISPFSCHFINGQLVI